MDENHPAHICFYTTKDPKAPIQDCPALTSMLHKVCKSDHAVFEEACRIVGLFMEEAYKRGLKDGAK
jgi:hypothetical protein